VLHNISLRSRFWLAGLAKEQILTVYTGRIKALHLMNGTVFAFSALYTQILPIIFSGWRTPNCIDGISGK